MKSTPLESDEHPNLKKKVHFIQKFPGELRNTIRNLVFVSVRTIKRHHHHQKIGAELHMYLEEGTYHVRLFKGPNTNDMK